MDSLKLEEIGPGFEHHANFPERINTEFVQVVDATHLKMRVWERGSGETWACGTGTCATVAALTELGICPAGEDIHVQLRGDSSPEGRAFPHQEEKFFFTTKKFPHSGELASSGREMTERVIPKQKRGKVL